MTWRRVKSHLVNICLQNFTYGGVQSDTTSLDALFEFVLNVIIYIYFYKWYYPNNSLNERIGTLSWSRCSFATHSEWAAHDHKVDGSNPTYGFYYNLYYNCCDFHNYYYYYYYYFYSIYKTTTACATTAGNTIKHSNMFTNQANTWLTVWLIYTCASVQR